MMSVLIVPTLLAATLVISAEKDLVEEEQDVLVCMK